MIYGLRSYSYVVWTFPETSSKLRNSIWSNKQMLTKLHDFSGDDGGMRFDDEDIWPCRNRIDQRITRELYLNIQWHRDNYPPSDGVRKETTRRKSFPAAVMSIL